MWGELSWREEPHKTDPTFYAPDFFLESAQPWLGGQYWQVVGAEEFYSSLLKLTQVKAELVEEGVGEERGPQESFVHVASKGLFWEEPTRSEFDRYMQDIRQAFAEGTLSKVVPVVFATADFLTKTESRLNWLQALTHAPDGLWAYGFWREEEGLLGASPELLFSLQERILETYALAGTRASSTTSSSLTSDPKECEEHRWVVEDISSRLTPFGDLDVGATHEWVIGPLTHLRTNIRLSLSQASPDFLTWVGCLHPTAALGGYPRHRAWQQLKLWGESQWRGRFGAPFGVHWPQNKISHCLVAIRNVQWQGLRLFLGSGCGVVPASQADKEWKELSLKRQSVCQLLGIQ